MGDRELIGVTLEFSDGTVQRPEKCACISISSESASKIDTTVDALGFSRAELEYMIWALLQFGNSLGMFDEINEKAIERIDRELILGDCAEEPAGMPWEEVL